MIAAMLLTWASIAVFAGSEQDQYSCPWHPRTTFAAEAAFRAHLCGLHPREEIVVNSGVCRVTPPPVLEPLPPVRALPLGNNWSLEDTISALRPLRPNEAQRRAAFLRHKLRIISALKPIGDAPARERPVEPANTTALRQRVKERLQQTRRVADLNEDGLRDVQEQFIRERRARSETVSVAPLPPDDLANHPLREYAGAADVLATRRIMNRLSALPRGMVLTLWSAERAYSDVLRTGTQDPWPARRALEQARRTAIAELDRRHAARLATWEDLFLLAQLKDDDTFARHVRRALRERLPR